MMTLFFIFTGLSSSLGFFAQSSNGLMKIHPTSCRLEPLNLFDRKILPKNLGPDPDTTLLNPINGYIICSTYSKAICATDGSISKSFTDQCDLQQANCKALTFRYPVFSVKYLGACKLEQNSTGTSTSNSGTSATTAGGGATTGGGGAETTAAAGGETTAAAA